ncbi:MAG: hypothetical protein BGO69_02470 [Bacteroidetes bacterium 46-16]|nr:MAG: hypothetical protein BGO69_02470 [Bacteroidetes bacterium 46-16]
MNKFMLLCLLLCCTATVHAQQKQYTDKDYARTPVWIDMMDDTTTNYFEAEKAYKIYWQHHEKPGGEHDIIGEHAEREKIPSKHRQKKIRQDDDMRMAVKKYERWRQRVLPYVQQDGRILGPAQRLAIFEAQKENNK